MMALSFSYSTLKMFQQCPKKFYELKVAKRFKDSQSSAAVYGDEAHKHLELRLKDGTPLPPTLQSWEGIAKRLATATVQPELEIVLDDTLKVIEEEGAWFSKRAWFRIKIDVVDNLSKDAILVCDWKTGKRKPDFDQMELYALAIFAKYPNVKIVKTAFIWLKDLKMDSETYVREQANALWAKHLGVVRQVYNAEESGNWPARPSGLCPYCPASPDGGAGGDCIYAQRGRRK